MTTIFQVKCKAALFTWHLDDQPLTTFIKKCDAQLKNKSYTASKEHSPTTLEDPDPQTHFHIYVHAKNQMDHPITYWNVDGKQPDCSPNTTTGSAALGAVCRGHFYVECRHKIGHLDQQTNFPWESYPVPVKTTWIIALWRQHKIATEDVPACLNFYRAATKYYLEVVNLALQYERTTARDAFHMARALTLEGNRMPYLTFGQVSKWKHQFNHSLMRYKFLVVSGASRTGKTGLINDLYPDAFVHEDVIDWTGYDSTKHSAIVYQDVHEWYKYVITHKSLFQANSRLVKVHTSPTNCHSITVDVAAKPMIFTTNEDIFEMACGMYYVEMPTSHRDYIEANCCHLQVKFPTYLGES